MTISYRNKWTTIKPTIERLSDSGAQWNELLTRFCLSSCYKQLLVSLTLKKAISPSVSYAAWPDPSVVNESEWKGLLVPLFSALFHNACILHSPAKGGQWVTLDEAVLTPEDGITPESVTSCLLKCDLKVVNTTSLMWRVFHFCSDEIELSLLGKCISPDFVVETLKRNPACYKELGRCQKLELLSYCMDVSEYSALEKLELLPLANGSFVQFQQRSSTANEVYLCTSEFPSFLLPSLENHLVNVNDNLQSRFEDLAAFGCTQVCEMTLETVATLLPQSIKKGWSVDQYKSFWTWVQSHDDLSWFDGCPVVPITDGHHILSVNLSAQTAKAVLITESNNDRLTSSLLGALKKIGVNLARQDKLCFLRHDNIFEYINRFTPEGVLSIASFSERIVFTFMESNALQTFLASSDITSTKSIKTLCRMRIFHTLQHENTSLFSIDKMANGSQYALAERSNCRYTISPKFLPLQPLVIAQRKNSTAQNTFRSEAINILKNVVVPQKA